jgi:hypothetical protein
MTASIDPIETALLVVRHLDALGILHTIGGSIASSFAGEPRSTVDIDIVVALEERYVDPLVAALSAEFYVDGDGRCLHVHPPEDILLQKLRWYRLGGEVSDRQWRDIAGIVHVQGARLDRPYLREGADILGVQDLLDRALAGLPPEN